MRRRSIEEASTNGKTRKKHFEDLKEVRKTVDRVRTFIAIVGLLLGGTFTFAKISGLPVIQISSDDWSRFFIQTALIIYFWSWMFGSKYDLNAQEMGARELLVGAKSRIYTLLGWCVGLVAIFVVLWRISTFTMFSLALAAFLALDLILYYFFYNGVLKKQFHTLSKQLVDEGNLISALEVDIVDEYMKGKWRYWRWGFGFVWIFTFLVVDYMGAAERLASLTGMFSSSSLLALSVLTLILILEGSQWAFRIIRLGKNLLLGDLRTKYDLTLKKNR